MENVGIFYDHLVHCTYSHLANFMANFVVIWYIFQLGYVVPRNIWQPWSAHRLFLMSFSAEESSSVFGNG
jgi:hypothetical protein